MRHSPLTQYTDDVPDQSTVIFNMRLRCLIFRHLIMFHFHRDEGSLYFEIVKEKEPSSLESSLEHNFSNLTSK